MHFSSGQVSHLLTFSKPSVASWHFLFSQFYSWQHHPHPVELSVEWNTLTHTKSGRPHHPQCHNSLHVQPSVHILWCRLFRTFHHTLGPGVAHTFLYMKCGTSFYSCGQRSSSYSISSLIITLLIHLLPEESGNAEDS